MKKYVIRTVFICIQSAALVLLGGCLSGSSDSAQSIGGNSAPTISGTPSAMSLVNQEYSFTPSATDPNNDPLTFSVRGEPTFLDINPTTGKLSGTPQLEDVGTYPGIVVSVSDGSLSDSLPQFSVDVVQNADGSITLSWTAPTQNEDGTELTDLASYKIYYGTSSRNYTTEIPVDLGTNTLVVENLTPDTYYFAATAINESGVESRFSGEAIKTPN